MATYLEIYNDIVTDSGMKARMTVALVKAADTIRQEDVGTANHTNRMAWAKNVIQNPESYARTALFAAAIQYAASDTATILASTDAQLQTAVDNIVNLLAGV